MDKKEELTHKKEMALRALQEKLSNAKNERQDKSEMIARIENDLKYVEDNENYDKKFEDLDRLVLSLINDANNEPSNPHNDDWINRLIDIRGALDEYRNAYSNYVVNLGQN